MLIGFSAFAQKTENEPQKNAWPNAVSYEIFVRSFADSDGDGIGDINGITAQLPYLKKLGVEGIWLTPISPSPTYHKYDVTDYRAIDPEYGTMQDFKNLVQEAHNMGIKIIPDLVANHSSSMHPWFLEAMKGKENPYHDYYLWNTTSNLKDTVNWHLTKDARSKGESAERYYGFFWSEMPDLNYDNPKVREEIIDIAKFWLQETDVDGFRLDAAQHIYDATEVLKNVAWWRQFREALMPIKKDLFLLGEVWNKDTIVARYLDQALSGCFNFDLSFALQAAAKKENAKQLVENLMRIRQIYAQYNHNFIDATILSNHDQNRIMNELNGNIKQAKMAGSLLLTLPGSPYVYYGEEIAMLGHKPDENIREPFIWDSQKMDPKQTSWMKPVFSNNATVVGAKQQMNDSSSFWNSYQKFLLFRAQNNVMRLGTLESAAVKNTAVCAFYRILDGDSLLVIHNLSKKEQQFNFKSLGLDWNHIELIDGGNYKPLQSKGIIAPYTTVVLSKRKKY